VPFSSTSVGPVHPISEDMALNEKCTCRQARSTRTTNTKAAKIKPIVEQWGQRRRSRRRESAGGVKILRTKLHCFAADKLEGCSRDDRLSFAPPSPELMRRQYLHNRTCMN
jgi:hypothetical protein